MRQRFSLALLVWLFAVWVMLWGSLSPLVVLSGVVVAVATLLLFPLPTRSGIFLRPLHLLRLVVFVLRDLLTSALGTAGAIVRHGPRVRAAVIAVPVLAERDHLIVAAANLVSLTPDTFVLQIDRQGAVFYVYLLGRCSDADLSRGYRQMLELQVRVADALGGREERREVRARAERARHRIGTATTDASSEEPL
jgi:multicomponent Na+:H+ antiporter subunit E